MFRSRIVIEATILELELFASKRENKRYICSIVTGKHLCGEFFIYLK